MFHVDYTFCKLNVKILAAKTKLCACVALDYHIMRNKYVSTKTQIFVSQAKEVPGTTFKVNTAYNF